MTTDESGATDPTTTEPTTTTPTTTTPSTAAPITTTQNPGGDLPEYTIPDDGSLDVNDVMEGYILSPRFDPDDPTGNRYPNNVNGQINLAVSDSVSRIFLKFFGCFVIYSFSLCIYMLQLYCWKSPPQQFDRLKYRTLGSPTPNNNNHLLPYTV